MKKYHIKFLVALLFIFYFKSSPLLFSQSVILDPPSISFQKQEGANIYEATTPVLVKIVALEHWAITCIAEPLIHDETGVAISTDQLFVKHDLSDDYQPMNNTIDLGNGESTNGEERTVNTLYLRVSASGQEPLGNFNGVVRFFLNSNETTQLTLMLTINVQIGMTISPTVVNFISSLPDVYSGDSNIELAIEGNSTNWHVEASIPQSSSNENFSGNNIYVKSSMSDYSVDEGAGIGFQALDQQSTVLSGEQVGQNGSTQLEFKIITNWNIKVGNYHSLVELKIPEIQYSQFIDLNFQVEEYNIFSLSESNVYFHANGPPAIWDGDKTAKVTVGSNCSQWSIICEASSLKSDIDEIPNSRLFIKIDPSDFTGDYGAGTGFYKLDIPELEIANGAQTPPKEICEMKFRLQTLDTDRPGHYEGTVTFTYLTNP